METVETTEDEDTKSDEDGSPLRPCISGWEQQARILVHHAHGGGQHGYDKRKTDTERLFRFSHCVPVGARQLLKAPYTRTVRTVVLS